MKSTGRMIDTVLVVVVVDAVLASCFLAVRSNKCLSTFN